MTARILGNRPSERREHLGLWLIHASSQPVVKASGIKSRLVVVGGGGGEACIRERKARARNLLFNQEKCFNASPRVAHRIATKSHVLHRQLTIVFEAKKKSIWQFPRHTLHKRRRERERETIRLDMPDRLPPPPPPPLRSEGGEIAPGSAAASCL